MCGTISKDLRVNTITSKNIYEILTKENRITKRTSEYVSTYIKVGAKSTYFDRDDL